MADSKVSDLTSATSVGGSDLLYLVQSNTSKKITADSFFGNTGNVTFKGNINIGGSVQTLATAGLINLSTPITDLQALNVTGSLILPTGTSGQIKYLVMSAQSESGNYTISSNVSGNATITFDHTGDTAQLMFYGTKWFMVGGTANVTY